MTINNFNWTRTAKILTGKVRNRLIATTVLMLTIGCTTTQTVVVPFHNDDAKFIKNIAILGPEQSGDMHVNITGDARVFHLLMGPAIIPQIVMALATRQANRDEAVYMNDMIFDFNIERILRQKFTSELKTNTFFTPVPHDQISENPQIMTILDKDEKTPDDYVDIAGWTGADTIIELSVHSYGIKDPGITSAPNVHLTADARMIRISDRKTLWQTRISENTKRKQEGLYYMHYTMDNAELLRFELEAAAEIIAKSLVQDMGFEIAGGIADIRETVTAKVISTLKEYEDLPQPHGRTAASVQLNSTGPNISPRLRLRPTGIGGAGR